MIPSVGGSIYQEDLVLLRTEMSNALFTSHHLQDNVTMHSIFLSFGPGMPYGSEKRIEEREPFPEEDH